MESDIHSFVGRSAEVAFVARGVRRCHRQTVGENAAEGEFEFGELREIVGEINGQGVALVGRARHGDAVEHFSGFHHRE